jgi:hypothetical protein
MFPDLPYRNALLIGTGGGNDIASAVMAATYLHRQGIKTDVAGVLNPAAMHYFPEAEQPLNKLHAGARRYIPSRKPKQLAFVDAALPALVKKLELPIDLYEISFRHGTDAAIAAVAKLAKQQGYDLVMGVDVGGDILARTSDTMVLSPLMDFSTLHLLQQLPAHAPVKTLLMEYGYGTDGELRPQGMGEILEELRAGALLHEGTISSSDPEVGYLRFIYDDIKKIRAGNTVGRTLQTLDASADIHAQHIIKAQIGRRKWESALDVCMPKEYFGKTYLIDPLGLKRDTAFSYPTYLEQYIKLQGFFPWKTELDLYYTGTPDFLVQLITPSALFPAEMREEMVAVGCAELAVGNVDALVARADAAVPSYLHKVTLGSFATIRSRAT